jgi:predicted dithiol-disulfide oxidoreductase (DUF899 family)
MFGPDWGDGCPHCTLLRGGSFDSVNSSTHRTSAHTAIAVVSRAPGRRLQRSRSAWVAVQLGFLVQHRFNFDSQRVVHAEQRKNGKAIYNFTPWTWTSMSAKA